MENKIGVLFGSTGYVGGKFKKLLPNLLCSKVDLRDYQTVFDYLSSIRPNFVINCAGFTGSPNVDQCELPEIQPLCLDGNVKIPLNLANICKELGIKLGHVSSGCIYEGSAWHSINDDPNFVGSFYSKTKKIGEEIIKDKGVYIWRLRIPFDEFKSPRNYITKLLTYDRVFGAPNSLSHLGDFVGACMKSFEQEPRIFNMTNAGHLPFTEVVSILKKYIPEANKLQITDFPILKAPRSNCTLENDPLMRDVREAFEEAVKNYH